MFGIRKETVELLKKQFTTGTRVELVHMEDSYRTLPPGETGTVTCVDDIGTIHVNWDCGSTLGLAYGVDICRKIDG